MLNPPGDVILDLYLHEHLKTGVLTAVSLGKEIKLAFKDNNRVHLFKSEVCFERRNYEN